MKTRILAALLCSASLAGAQTPPQAGAGPDPANPDAAVPRAAYRSVFADTPRGVESGTTAWPQANADVGQFRRGHVDLLKWEAQHLPAGKSPAPSAHDHHGGHKP